MGKSKGGQARGKYTLEFKMEAVRVVKGGQAVPVTAKILGVPSQTLGNWCGRRGDHVEFWPVCKC
jgi:transposase-like protein